MQHQCNSFEMYTNDCVQISRYTVHGINDLFLSLYISYMEDPYPAVSSDPKFLLSAFVHDRLNIYRLEMRQ